MRTQGWERRLSKYLTEKNNAPFQWGENDCVLFAAKAVEAVSGYNFYQDYLPYTTEEEAKAILDINGGIEGLVAKFLGGGYINYRLAKRGDVVLIKSPLLSLGIVDDSGQKIVSVGPEGAVRLPLKMATRVWSF